MGGGKKKKRRNATQLNIYGENIENSEAENKSSSRLNVTHVKYKKDPRYKQIIDVSSPPFSRYDTEFHIIKRNDQSGRKETLEPTPK
eukprot:185195-Ditylum_brightwellii.AAC.1